MKELTKEYILELLRNESDLQYGDIRKFRFEKWVLSLRREPEEYKTFKYALEGIKDGVSIVGTRETWARRYITLESALLHVVNHFNENANVKNEYSTINEFLERKHIL